MLVENVLIRKTVESFSRTIKTIPAWAGRHWKPLSIVAVALGGGYALSIHDSNSQNPSNQPDGSRLGIAVPASETPTAAAIPTITVTRSDCAPIPNTNEWTQLLCDPVTGCHQNPCSPQLKSERLNAKTQPTWFTETGEEKLIPQIPGTDIKQYAIGTAAENTALVTTYQSKKDGELVAFFDNHTGAITMLGKSP